MVESTTENNDKNGNSKTNSISFLGDKKPFERILHFTPQLFLLIIIAIIGVDAFSSNSTPLLHQLSDPATARGLITLLISVGAVWVAIILAVGAFSNADEKQFSRAKDVLVIMIGLLGTIVGYYFGAESQKSPQEIESTIAAPIEAFSSNEK